jgi:hypothetical protein
MGSDSKTLDQALAYLTPHPRTNGPVILDPAKMRVSQSLISAEFARLNADLAACAVGFMDDQSRQFIQGSDRVEAEELAARHRLAPRPPLPSPLEP